jgi:uncharacterized protein (DUF2384 family)
VVAGKRPPAAGATRESPESKARAKVIERLTDQVEQMVRESGRPEGFNAEALLLDWLEHPVPALGNRRPAELLDTAGGEQCVAQILSRMRSGAYS